MKGVIRVKKEIKRSLQILLCVILLAAAMMVQTIQTKAQATDIKSMHGGDKVSFAGHSWIVLNPSTGYLLMEGLYGGPCGFGSTTAFKGSIIESVLNNNFYNSLPSGDRALIQKHNWGTVEDYVGLISAGEWQAYFVDYSESLGGFLEGQLQNYWTLTPCANKWVYFVSCGTSAYLGNVEPDYQRGVRPALYIDPNIEVYGGAVTHVNSEKSNVVVSETSVNTGVSSTITVTLKDYKEDPMSDVPLKLMPSSQYSAINGGTSGSQAQVTTDSSGVATFTVSDTKPETVIYTVTATAINVPLAQTASVTFIPPDVDKCSVTVDKTNVLSNGSDKSTITVTLKYNDGTPAAGKTVVLSKDSGHSNITAVNGGITDSSGTATFNVTDAYAETVVYTATDTTDNMTVSNVSVIFDSYNWIVDSLSDDGSLGTLRYAIQNAPSGTNITFKKGLDGIIVLNSALPPINKNLDIDGSGSSVTISGNNLYGVLEVDSGSVFIKGITVSDGSVIGAIDGKGGGLLVKNGTVFIDNVTFKNNKTTGCKAGVLRYDGESGKAYGGAIYVEAGSLVIANSLFESNSSTGGEGASTGFRNVDGGNGQGGAIFLNSGKLTINSSTFKSNSSIGGKGGTDMFSGAIGGSGEGGAIFLNSGSLIINNSTFNGNSSTGGTGGTGDFRGGNGGNGEGGAIYNQNGSFTIRDSSFSGNNAVGGAGSTGEFPSNNGTNGSYHGTDFYNKSGTVTLINVTFSPGNNSYYNEVLTIERIIITTPATKLSYIVGDSLDINGMVVTEIYSDGTTKDKAVTEADISGFDSSVPAASQTLTVTVSGKTTTYTIEIKAALQSIAITKPATKLSYTVGDSLDISGMEVTGTYSDSTTKVETITKTDISGFNTSAPAASQTLTVTVGGKTTTYTIEIKAAVNNNNNNNNKPVDNQTTKPETTPTTTETHNVSTATTKAEATVDNTGKATAAVTHTQVNDAVSKAAEEAVKQGNGTKAVVEIKVEAASDVKTVETDLPKTAVDAVADSNTAALTVSTPVAAITFSDKAIDTISGQAAADVKITATKVDAGTLSEVAKQAIGDKPVYNFSVTSGSKTISQFGGNVTVAVPYTLKPGEDANAIVIYYINAEGKPEMVTNCHYDQATGKVTFSTNHFSQYAVGYNKVSFKDVPADAWYAKAVGFISARNISGGTGSGSYNPAAKLTRGEFLVMLMRAYGIKPDESSKDNFTDAGSTYYTGYLAAAKRLGITGGVGNNKFAPDKEITRQEMFTLLYNALKVIGELPKGTSGKQLSAFSDAGLVAPWARDAMTLFVQTGTISGSGGKLYCESTTTRAEIAQVLYNLLTK